MSQLDEALLEFCRHHIPSGQYTPYVHVLVRATEAFYAGAAAMAELFAAGQGPMLEELHAIRAGSTGAGKV